MIDATENEGPDGFLPVNRLLISEDDQSFSNSELRSDMESEMKIEEEKLDRIEEEIPEGCTP